MQTMTAKPIRCSLFLMLIILPVVAGAQAYKFEMIVFERPGTPSDEFWPAEPGYPDRANAVGILGAQAATKRLGPIAYTLRQQGMNVLTHLAWIQRPGRRNGNSWRWLGAGRLSGLVRLTRGRFLHLDTDLLLQDPSSAFPYRVQVNRRMRSGELHYVDHPKVGILLRATRLKPASSSPPDSSTGEPKPVQPNAAVTPTSQQ